MKRHIATVVLVVAVAIALSLGSQAQTPYYAKKTIELVVGFPPGGLTDLQARLMAPYFEKHLPGHPRVEVRNMPGGQAILAANWFGANAKPDGLTLFVSGSSPLIGQVLKLPEVKYDLLKWNLISMNGGGGVFFVSPRTGVKKPGDLLKPREPLVFGGLSPTGTDLTILIALDILGLNNIRTILGFEGKGPILLAFERGELNIDNQTTAAAYLSNVVPLVEQGKAVPVMSLGYLNERGQVVRDPVAPDIPSVHEAYQEIYGRKPDNLPEWKAYLAMLAVGFSYRGGVWAPEGTPPEILRTLRDSIDKMNDDPEFRQGTKALFEHFPLLRGDLVEDTLRKILDVTPDVSNYIKNLLRTKYNTVI